VGDQRAHVDPVPGPIEAPHEIRAIRRKIRMSIVLRALLIALSNGSMRVGLHQ
jgi:hypothetical protein